MTDLFTVLAPVLAVLLAAIAALVAAAVLRFILNRVFGRVPGIREQSARARNPFRITLALVGAHIGLGLTSAAEPWFPTVDFIVMVGVIAALGWLAIVVLLVGEALLLTRFRTQAQDTRRTRRLETQVTLGRRVAVALIVTLAVASLLLTIPEVRALGTGILASAGLISIVAGLAVQSSLTNVFAGVQLAFTDAIRIDDVVVVEKLWGKIEEITMTYVVVRVWDERMLILPSTYFTTTPFENWTRTNSKIMGTVELDLDWRVPVEELRAHLASLLDGTDLWDGRTGALQVTDATGDFVRLRILVSAADSGSLWDLRCLVRESMVVYLQTRHPGALPRHRWQSVQTSPDDDGEAPTAERDAVRAGAQRDPVGSAAGDVEHGKIYGGSTGAEERRQQFSGPGEDAFEERERKSVGNPA